MKPVIEMKDYGYQYPGRATWALSGLTLSVQPGECLCLTGPSGCGKSTLFLAIKGLLKSGRQKGALRVANGNGHGHSGLVFQNAESQLLCTTVSDEVAFGPQNLGFDPKEIEAAVGRSLKAVSLNGLERRNVEALSAGQTHRVAIASVISTAPGMILLDEPTAQLDVLGKRDLKGLLERIKASGTTLIIADHELGPFESLADRYVFLDRGRLRRVDASLPEGFSLSTPPPKRRIPDGEPGFLKPVLSARNLTISGANGRPLLDHIDFQLFPGRRTLVHGQNGAGKSTFLKCMAGFIRAETGSIRITGLGRPEPSRLLGKMGLLFQNPERQIFEDTVETEVSFSLKRMGLPQTEIKARVEQMLEIFEVGHLRHHSPLTLSFGEQHRVTLASVMAPKPHILLLDEPFAGLDFVRRRRVLKMLSRLCQNERTTVLIASHEFLPDETWADDTFHIKDGHIDKL